MKVVDDDFFRHVVGQIHWQAVMVSGTASICRIDAPMQQGVREIRSQSQEGMLGVVKSLR